MKAVFNGLFMGVPAADPGALPNEVLICGGRPPTPLSRRGSGMNRIPLCGVQPWCTGLATSMPFIGVPGGALKRFTGPVEAVGDMADRVNGACLRTGASGH